MLRYVICPTNLADAPNTLPPMPTWVTSARAETPETVVFLSAAAFSNRHVVFARKGTHWRVLDCGQRSAPLRYKWQSYDVRDAVDKSSSGPMDLGAGAASDWVKVLNCRRLDEDSFLLSHCPAVVSPQQMSGEGRTVASASDVLPVANVERVFFGANRALAAQGYAADTCGSRISCNRIDIDVPPVFGSIAFAT